MLVAAAAGIGSTLSASELGLRPSVRCQAGRRPYERDRHHGFPRCDGFGRRRLGSGYSYIGIASYLIGGAILLSISLILAISLSINSTRKLDFDPGSVTSFSQTSFSHKLIALPQPQDGPVAITYEFEVDRVREDEVLELMGQVRLIHLRNSAFSWQLHEDLTQFNIFQSMIVPSWTQYVLQRDRMTKAEKNLIDEQKAYISD